MNTSSFEAVAASEQFPTEENFEAQVEAHYERFLRIPEVEEALTLLDHLPETLVYHRKGHTLDVIHDTILFALADNVSEDVLKQQVIAAAWHDVGYIKELVNEEKLTGEAGETESRAINLFLQSVASKRMAEKDVSEVRANIWDTRVVENAGVRKFSMNDSRYGYMLDGDLSNVGRQDFKENLEKYAREIGLDLLDSSTRKKYYTDTLTLFQNHDWKTKPARFYREKKKRENLRWLEEEIAAL